MFFFSNQLTIIQKIVNYHKTSAQRCRQELVEQVRHFFNFYISHVSVTWFLRDGKKYNIYFVDNLLLFPTVKAFTKSVNSDKVIAKIRDTVYIRPNTVSDGPILCATDQPQLVLTDTRSLLHCSTMCLHSEQCLNFNYKDTARICEQFSGYPFKFTVDPDCHHYAVRPNFSVFLILKIDGKLHFVTT